MTPADPDLFAKPDPASLIQLRRSPKSAGWPPPRNVLKAPQHLVQAGEVVNQPTLG